MMKINLRALSVVILQSVLENHTFLSNALPEELKKAGVIGKDQALVQALCYGVLRHYHRLSALAKNYLQKPLKAKDQDVHLVILLGLYQLTSMRVPAHAVVAETVDAAKALKKNWASGLINAILRQFIREPQNLPELSIVDFEHPVWLLGKIKKAYPESWQKIVLENLMAPPMHIRVNRLKTSREEYLSLLQDAQIAASRGEIGEESITLETPVDVSQLPRFAEGYVSVQDLAAQMAVCLLDLDTGQRVLDACAAPGGKTAHILESQAKLAELIALDVDEKRLRRVEENLKRLQLQATLLCADGVNVQSWWDGQSFDRILLDAPCSATGVIRRHPDIRLLRSPEEVVVAVKQQSALLSALWSTLKPGGILLYATCSILPEENDRQIATFLENHADAKIVPISLSTGINTQYGWQFLPTEQSTDGFYYAKLQKILP